MTDSNKVTSCNARDGEIPSSVQEGLISLILDCAKSDDGFYKARQGADHLIVDENSWLPVTAAERERFFDLFENAQVFLFASEDKPSPPEMDRWTLEMNIDLPFPICYFSVLPSSNGEIDMQMMSRSGSTLTVASVAALVCEIAPTVYDIYSLEIHLQLPREDDGKEMSVKGTEPFLVYYPSVRGKDTYAGIVVYDRLRGLSRSVVGEERINQKVRIGTGSCRRQHVIRKVIHVVPRKLLGEAQPIRSGNSIKWSHRWHVRGHWRSSLNRPFFR